MILTPSVRITPLLVLLLSFFLLSTAHLAPSQLTWIPLIAWESLTIYQSPQPSIPSLSGPYMMPDSLFAEAVELSLVSADRVLVNRKNTTVKLLQIKLAEDIWTTSDCLEHKN